MEEEDDGYCYFAPEHVLVALARSEATLLIDSHWAEQRALTVRVHQGAMADPRPGLCARHVLLHLRPLP